MNLNTPTISDPPTAAKTANVQIAVAVIATPPDWFTHLSHVLLQRALAAGLKRKGIQESEPVYFFRKLFSVRLFEVIPSAKLPAIECLKETLSDLGVMHRTAIAIVTADKICVAFHPESLKGKTFEEIFLREEYFKAALADLEKLDALTTLLAEMTPEEMVQLLQAPESEK